MSQSMQLPFVLHLAGHVLSFRNSYELLDLVTLNYMQQNIRSLRKRLPLPWDELLCLVRVNYMQQKTP